MAWVALCGTTCRACSLGSTTIIAGSDTPRVAIAARQRWLDDSPCHRQIGRGGLLGDRVVMSRRLVRFGRQLWIVLILCWVSATAFAKDYPTAPRLKDNHGKFRIAYLQGGPFFEYDEVFAALVHALARNGWARQITIPPEATRTAQDLFAYLAAHKEWSDYLEFPPDAFFDSGWQDRNRAANQQKILKRTDIDMILAFGTWAGSDMKEMPKEFDRVPVVVVDVSDPLRSRIVDSNQDTGRDSLTARVDPRRYQRQARLFHDVVGFRKLGVAFEGTVEGRSYAAIEDIEVVARKKGFTVVKAEHPGYFKSRGEAEKWLIRSARDLGARDHSLAPVLREADREARLREHDKGFDARPSRRARPRRSRAPRRSTAPSSGRTSRSRGRRCGMPRSTRSRRTSIVRPSCVATTKRQSPGGGLSTQE